MNLIDFHMHPYLTGSQYTGMYLEPGPESGKNVMDKIRCDMERAGISHVCGSVIGGGNTVWKGSFHDLKELNRSALGLKNMSDGFYTPGFHIHPEFVRESIEEIEYMAEHGVRLIGELVPYAHGGYSYSSGAMDKILQAAEAYGMVVSYHSTDDDDADRMVERHPKLTFVAAHPGEKPRVEQRLERMRRYDNLYLDLSGTGLARLGILAYSVRRLGAERFLFGTDYPINNPAMYVHGVLYEALSDRERRMICYENAERILGIHIFAGEGDH